MKVLILATIKEQAMLFYVMIANYVMIAYYCFAGQDWDKR